MGYRVAPFRVYHDVAESIADHGRLLAGDPAYVQAMADRHTPDAFATDLTGVYATDPNYGTNLIALMRRYDLYGYDTATSAAAPHGSGHAAGPAAGSASAGSASAGSAIRGLGIGGLGIGGPETTE